MAVTKAPPIKNSIAKTVYDGRIVRGWNQSTLAKKAGVTQARISELENGTRDYRIETAEKVLKALGFYLTIK